MCKTLKTSNDYLNVNFSLSHILKIDIAWGPQTKKFIYHLLSTDIYCTSQCSGQPKSKIMPKIIILSAFNVAAKCIVKGLEMF